MIQGKRIPRLKHDLFEMLSLMNAKELDAVYDRCFELADDDWAVIIELSSPSPVHCRDSIYALCDGLIENAKYITAKRLVGICEDVGDFEYAEASIVNDTCIVCGEVVKRYRGSQWLGYCAKCLSVKLGRDTAASKRVIPLRLRFQVFVRDNYCCVYCGASAKDGVKLTVDHVVPYTKGGATTRENLVAACQECNVGKADSDIQN